MHVNFLIVMFSLYANKTQAYCQRSDFLYAYSKYFINRQTILQIGNAEFAPSF